MSTETWEGKVQEGYYRNLFYYVFKYWNVHKWVSLYNQRLATRKIWNNGYFRYRKYTTGTFQVHRTYRNNVRGIRTSSLYTFNLRFAVWKSYNTPCRFGRHFIICARAKSKKFSTKSGESCIRNETNAIGKLQIVSEKLYANFFTEFIQKDSPFVTNQPEPESSLSDKSDTWTVEVMWLHSK